MKLDPVQREITHKDVSCLIRSCNMKWKRVKLFTQQVNTCSQLTEFADEIKSEQFRGILQSQRGSGRWTLGNVGFVLFQIAPQNITTQRSIGAMKQNCVDCWQISIPGAAMLSWTSFLADIIYSFKIKSAFLKIQVSVFTLKNSHYINQKCAEQVQI